MNAAITNPTGSLIWRWLALIAVLLNIGLNYWTNAYPMNGQRIGEVSAQYPTLFTPAGYAFAIWGLIYLTLLVYIIYQLLPAQRNEKLFDRLAKPLLIISLLSMAWVISFSYELITLSAILLLSMLGTSLRLLIRCRQMPAEQKRYQWVRIPFSLYAGWLSVAAIANTAVWLSSLGWNGGAWGEVTWAIIMVITAFLIGLLTSWRLRDIVYPLVIVWASVAIWSARKEEAELIGTVALVCAAILAAWSIGYGLWLLRHPSPRLSVG